MQFPNVTKLACELDDFLRKRDFASGRTAGGFLHRHFGIDRHTVWAILLPTAACFFAVLATPNRVRFAWASIVAIVVGFAITLPMAVFARKQSALWLDLLVQIVVVSGVMAAMFRAPIQYSESSPYL